MDFFYSLRESSVESSASIRRRSPEQAAGVIGRCRHLPWAFLALTRNKTFKAVQLSFLGLNTFLFIHL